MTVRHVAARAGVGLSTVSNVLNRPEAVAPATYARVMAAIEELGYVRNDAARALRLGESRAVGVIVADASSPFFADVTVAAGQALSEHGYSMLVGNSLHDAKVERGLIDLFEAQRVGGLLISPLTERPKGLGTFAGRGIPVVYIDVAAPVADYCSVAVDDAFGARLAVEHLASVGRKRLVLIRSDVDIPQIRERIRGAMSAAAELGITIEEITTSSGNVQGGAEAAAVIVGRTGARAPDGLFAVNDMLAMGAMAALIDRGVRVPSDIAVVGLDDSDMAVAARLPLTTVRRPARELGVRAAALLLEEIRTDDEHPHESTLFAPELVVRASTI